MILLNGDLPLEIPPVKSKSQVISRPVQDLSCKWHEFAYTLFHSTSLHLFPISPLLEQASQQQEQVTLSAPGDPVRLTIHKVLQSAQSKPAEQTEPGSPQQPLGLYGATADLLAGTCAPLTAMLPPSCSSAQVWGPSLYKMIVKNQGCKTCF